MGELAQAMDNLASIADTGFTCWMVHFVIILILWVSKQFRIGQGGVESGLEEGVLLLLHEGDKATFIMPPHLAHGLPGDGNRIPARSIIVYEVELVKVEP